MSNSNMTANSSQNQTFIKEMMGSYKPSTNGSLSLGPTMSKAIRTQAHISLVNASIIAEKAVGANAHTVKARIGVWTNGAIVYLALVVDSKDNFHGVVVDAKNGKVIQSSTDSFFLLLE